MADAHKNFAASTVATAPSPATTGTSLVVAAGQGALFPAVPFNATVWPAGTQPTAANAEIVRVTNISTDTFTITRTQESTSARTILVGDQVAATITAKTLTDVDHAQSHDHSAAGDGTTLTPAVLNLPAAVTPAQTADGQAVWDSDDNLLTVGDGASRQTFLPVVDATSDPAAVSTAAADGTEATLARKDHVHAHEPAHINHDTTWAAQGDLIVGTGNDTAAVLTKGASGTVLQAGATTLAYATLLSPITFTKTGTVAVGTGATRWYNDTGGALTLVSVRAAVGTAPTGATLIVDVNNNGTTVYGTQTNRPTIAISGNTAEGGAMSDTTIADGEYLTVDVDQVGSTVAGADLTITIWMSS